MYPRMHVDRKNMGGRRNWPSTVKGAQSAEHPCLDQPVPQRKWMELQQICLSPVRRIEGASRGDSRPRQVNKNRPGERPPPSLR